MFAPQIIEKARQIIEKSISNRTMVATGESCTGGLVAAALTEIAGSSAVVDRGFVTYSNEAKNALLGVPESLIEDHGAVSAEVAEAMVIGVLQSSRADHAVAVTGIAGPGGGSDEKPVGLVYISAGSRGKAPLVSKELFGDIGRAEVREATVIRALDLLYAELRP
ncbi:MAG: CinA family protein [Pseudomonadota bacterium]